jgi:Uma2 family endonuclease
MATDVFPPVTPAGPPILPPEFRPKVEHLVTEDDAPVDNLFSEKQMRLLTEPLYTSWAGPGENRPFLACANVGLFYAVNQPPVVPDVFLSLDVKAPQDLWPKKHRSYFLWEYGKAPDAAIEIVSNTEGEELTGKLEIYARVGIPYYAIWDPNELLQAGRLQAFRLKERNYERMSELWFPVIGLGMSVWHGLFEDSEADWLRWCDRQGQVVPTGAERAERLAAQLRAAGIEPQA